MQNIHAYQLDEYLFLEKKILDKNVVMDKDSNCDFSNNFHA